MCGPAPDARCARRRRQASRGAPVDGADVVAGDVLPQRVELRALAADQYAVRPSSSRSRANLDGRCLRLVNGGSTRTVHGARWLPCRAESPAGRASGR